MAVKKKKAVKKTAAKKTSSKKGYMAGIRRTSKKMVDNMLVKISPQLQDKIDHLIATLESSRRGGLSDLSLMAGKILMRAQDISRNLQSEKKPAKGKKR